LGAFLLGVCWKKRWLKWVGGISCGVVTAGVLAFGLFLGIAIAQSMHPPSVFKQEFGRRPGEEIQSLKSSTWHFGDSGFTLLQFETSLEEFEKLVPKGLERLGPADFKDRFAYQLERHPEWVALKSGEALIYGTSRKTTTIKGIFTSEWMVMTYSPANKLAQYYYSGLD
jgi:hypothetical protein